MSEWVAAQPAETSAAAWAAVDELAHATSPTASTGRWTRPGPTR